MLGIFVEREYGGASFNQVYNLTFHFHLSKISDL